MNRLSILTLSVVPSLLLFSCGEKEPPVNEVVEVENMDPEMPELDDFDYDALRGMYVGDFGGSDIRIIINYISATNAIGYNIHRGLQRNISGKVSRSGDSIMVHLAEPGDHKFDGVFELLFLGIDPDPGGLWVSNNGKIPQKKFSLTKMNTTEKGYIEDFENTDVTTENLHTFFGESSDTLGDYNFKSDGLVIFSYYPGGYDWDREERSAQQMEQIQGTWSLNEKLLTIDWAENNVFPTRKMSYQVRKEDWDIELYREGNSIYMHMYP